MKTEWVQWIEDYVAKRAGFVRGLCQYATAEMVEVFPELRRVAGLVRWTAPNGREVIDEHWWCVASDGAIVDPTEEQFYGPVEYEELDLRNPADVARIPTGKCMDCGAYVYNGDTFCNEKCERATRDHMGLD